MLIFILIDVQYIQNAIFCFEKGSNRQNHYSSGSHHLVNPPPLTKISNPPDQWWGMYPPPTPTPYLYLENPVLPSQDSKISGAIVKMAKTNTILKRAVNESFTVKNTYHDNDQTDKAKEQKLRREAAVIGELKIKYEC